MRRRDFITLVGGAAALAPLVARAQQPGRTYRLGILVPIGRQSPQAIATFDEFRRHGFIEGQNLEIVPGGFDVPQERIPERVPALVQARPDVIIIAGMHGTRAVQQATQTIPIVAMSEDMLADGLVDSLSRPGRNTTGISLLSPDLDGKRQDLLIELAPKARHIATLFDSNITLLSHTQKLQAAAKAQGVTLSLFGAATAAEIVPAIDAAKAEGAQAINFLAAPLYSINSRIVFDRITALRLPAMHQWPDMAEDGALAGYGPWFNEVFRQRARLAVKVLRGTKPADIPVEQPTRFELVINLKTAWAIGHEVPAGLVLRADKVIE